jgi:hypothetical protein
MYACQIPGKGLLDKGPVLSVIYRRHRAGGSVSVPAY